MDKKLDVVTIGGSLAGLFTSIVLRQQGHNVTIYERSPTPLLHNQGAGIVAGGETQIFMSQHDRTKRPIAVTSKERLYLDKKGGIIDREDTVQRMTSWDLIYYLCRAGFDGVDSEYLDGRGVPEKREGEGNGSYEYGRLVTELKESDDGKVKVSFKHVREDEDEAQAVESVTADLVVVADGPSSRMRRLLLPSAAERTYAGYLAFRGTVPETSLSQDAKDVFVEKFPFFHGMGTQILAYTIPGTAGNLSVGHRLVNWVWYVNVAEDTDEYRGIMTDTDGNTHRYTLPTGGKMRDAVWGAQKERAKACLPPQYYELVSKTTMPFVQAITDLPPPGNGQCRFLDGNVIMVGDALSGFRPHTAASTSQAAFHALILEEVLSGEIDWQTYEDRVIGFARSWQHRGVILGQRSQFGHHPLSG